ncbi:hypothetical protein D3C87_1786440 [compost metagenome]
MQIHRHCQKQVLLAIPELVLVDMVSPDPIEHVHQLDKGILMLLDRAFVDCYQ